MSYYIKNHAIFYIMRIKSNRNISQKYTNKYMIPKYALKNNNLYNSVYVVSLHARFTNTPPLVNGKIVIVVALKSCKMM